MLEFADKQCDAVWKRLMMHRPTGSEILMAETSGWDDGETLNFAILRDAIR